MSLVLLLFNSVCFGIFGVPLWALARRVKLDVVQTAQTRF